MINKWQPEENTGKYEAKHRKCILHMNYVKTYDHLHNFGMVNKDNPENKRS